MSKILTFSAFLLISLASLGAIYAQESLKGDSEDQTCTSPVYTSREVSRRAKITHLPAPVATEEFRVKQQKGRGVLIAILCKTGKVTNIEIVEGLAHGMNEKLIEAVRGVRFIPAEKDGQAVSQRQVFEFHISMF